MVAPLPWHPVVAGRVSAQKKEGEAFLFLICCFLRKRRWGMRGERGLDVNFLQIGSDINVNL